MTKPIVWLRKPDTLIHVEAAKAAGIQVIKRFTGGGTVVVDHNTTFCSLIFRAEDVEGVECYPRPVMQWSEGFYKPVFAPHGEFSLREHGAAHTLCFDGMVVKGTRRVPCQQCVVVVSRVCRGFVQITHLVSANLVATRRRSPSSVGCTTHLFCGIFILKIWLY